MVDAFALFNCGKNCAKIIIDQHHVRCLFANICPRFTHGNLKFINNIVIRDAGCDLDRCGNLGMRLSYVLPPISDFFKATASFTPSPVIATTLGGLFL
jgi:hypothetical protein